MKSANVETRKASYAFVGMACLSLMLVVSTTIPNKRANPSGDPKGELPSAQMKSR